jgi:ASF1 like histone chaperone
MSLVNVTNIEVIDPIAPFQSPMQFEVTFEVRISRPPAVHPLPHPIACTLTSNAPVRSPRQS